VADLDLLDDAPLLDIKPYAPDIDVLSVERSGWPPGRRERLEADGRFEPPAV
jgi:tRNA (Thr-GGU) A37 N-methylase